jgi:transposase InsO family protein
MLLSDADRELLYERLSRHAGAGRIGIDELERRVAAIAEARTREQAAEVMSDLPPLGEGERSRRRRWGRGHGESGAPAPDWHPTNERFRDPASDKVMRVWVDAGGGRHYVADEEP